MPDLWRSTDCGVSARIGAYYLEVCSGFPVYTHFKVTRLRERQPSLLVASGSCETEAAARSCAERMAAKLNLNEAGSAEG